jgi:hypothetical protein
MGVGFCGGRETAACLPAAAQEQPAVSRSKFLLRSAISHHPPPPPPPHTHTHTADDKHGNGADTYLHRVGRAGRFGTKGLAITFVASPADSEVLNQVQVRWLRRAEGSARVCFGGGACGRALELQGWPAPIAGRRGLGGRGCCGNKRCACALRPGQTLLLRLPTCHPSSRRHASSRVHRPSPLPQPSPAPPLQPLSRSALTWTSSRCRSTSTPPPT